MCDVDEFIKAAIISEVFSFYFSIEIPTVVKILIKVNIVPNFSFKTTAVCQVACFKQAVFEFDKTKLNCCLRKKEDCDVV
jgi:hypothetical protein